MTLREAQEIYAEAKAGALAAWRHRPVDWARIMPAHEEYSVALANLHAVAKAEAEAEAAALEPSLLWT